MYESSIEDGGGGEGNVFFKKILIEEKYAISIYLIGSWNL